MDLDLQILDEMFFCFGRWEMRGLVGALVWDFFCAAFGFWWVGVGWR